MNTYLNVICDNATSNDSNTQSDKINIRYTCSICEKYCSDDAVECCNCLQWYHYECQDLSDVEVELLEGNNNQTYRCLSCEHVQDFLNLEVSDRDSVVEIDQLNNKPVPSIIDKCQINTHVRNEETYAKTPISSVQSSQIVSQQTRSVITTISSDKSSLPIMSTTASNKDSAKGTTI